MVTQKPQPTTIAIHVPTWAVWTYLGIMVPMTIIEIVARAW